MIRLKIAKPSIRGQLSETGDHHQAADRVSKPARTGWTTKRQGEHPPAALEGSPGRVVLDGLDQFVNSLVCTY